MQSNVLYKVDHCIHFELSSTLFDNSALFARFCINAVRYIEKFRKTTDKARCSPYVLHTLHAGIGITKLAMNHFIDRFNDNRWGVLFQITIAFILGVTALSSQAATVFASSAQDWPMALPQQDILVHEDRDARMTLADVVTLEREHPDQFQPLAATELPASSRSAWWFKLDVENESLKTLDLRLILNASIRGRVDYYVRQDGQWHHTAMGAGIPVDARTAHTARRQALPFVIEPKQRTSIIARVSSASLLAIEPQLYDRPTYEAGEQKSAMWAGILFGGILVLAWGALLIAVLSRSVSFGLLAVLCMTTAVYEASRRGYTKIYLWPEASDWALRSSPFLGFTAATLVLTFILAIARLEAVHIPGRKLIVAIICFQAFTGLTGLFGDVYWATQLTPFAMALYAIGAVSCAVLLLRASVPGSRFLIIAGLFIASHTLLRLLEQIGWLPQVASDLGFHSPGDNTILALARLGINISVLTAWIMIIARQRRDANNELIRMRESERDRLKEQVAIQTEALNRSLQYANEENRRKTETLSYVGHDLRAPLATIVGYTRLLSANATPTQEAHINAIERSANYQMSLIDEIVDYARHEQPTPLDITMESTSLRELLNNIMQHAEALARHQNNRLALHAQTPLPTMIKTDHKRLQQVLLNLISNAAKFTRNGYIHLAIGLQRSQEETELVFHVEDSGAGIAPAHQHSIFDAYTQLDARPGSAGLGLHIAQRIIKNMNGRISLDSRPGEGSRFSLHIPVELLTEDTMQIDDIVAATRPEDEQYHLLSTQQIPPVELRVDLAKFAREGELSSIEHWLSQQTTAHPSCAPFFSLVQQALKALDFDRIETLALANTK